MFFVIVIVICYNSDGLYPPELRSKITIKEREVDEFAGGQGGWRGVEEWGL